MANFHLKRFSDPSVLKALAPQSLLNLLSQHRDYFSSRGLELPRPSAASSLDYGLLTRILISPDEGTPAELATALFFIHGMATEEGMDALLSVEPSSPALKALTPEMTPADVALHFWLLDPERLGEKHAETVYLVRPRAFECCQTRSFPPPEFEVPSMERTDELAESLAARFSRKRRGHHCRVSFLEKETQVWILVCHGGAFKREGSVEGQESSSVYYRPETWDVLVYVKATGELRMHAGSKGERELYRQAFGLCFFGDDNAFAFCSRYTLEPLRQQGRLSLVCSDIEGIEQVVLKEVCLSWNREVLGRQTFSGDDVFSMMKASNPVLLELPIVRAKFQITFSDSKRHRSVTIQANRAQYQRDQDSLLVEKWLTARGFVILREATAHAA